MGETTYSINAIPFGGFVKIFGESPDGDSIAGPDSARSFVNKPKWVQIIILAAGVIMNVLFAWILLSISYMSGMTTAITDANSSYIENSHVIVLDALPNSPARKAGLTVGDEILAFSVKGATTTVSTVQSIQELTRNSQGQAITFEIQRLAKIQYVTLVPEKNTATGNYAIGISMDMVGNVQLPFFSALWEGAQLTGRVFVNIAVGLYTLIHDAVMGDADLSQLSGPVGIARLVGDAGQLGFIYLLSFTAFISLNLAVLNLIPFPALDGGRILFVIIEAIRRKPISPVVANTCNTIGFALLLAFMLFVTYKDIVKLF